MRINNLDSILIRALYLCISAMVIFQLFSLSAVTTILFYFTFVLVVFMWISLLSRAVDSQDVLCLILMFVTFFNVLLNATILSSVISFTYLKKTIMFFSTIVFFRVASKLNIREQERIFLKRCISVIVCTFIVMYFFNNEAMRGGSRFLVFNFTNPNLTGMFLFCFLVAEVIFFYRSETVKEKIYHGVLFIFLFWFILETQARNAMITLIIFSIFTVVLFFQKQFNGIKIRGGIATLVTVFPLLFSWAYMALISNPILSTVFNFIVSEGKALTSRHSVWSKAINAFLDSPFIGAYSQISDGTGQSQFHNTHLDILASYGFVVFILVCLFIGAIIYNRGNFYRTKSSYIAMVGFSCVILLGMGEAAVFSGGFGLNYFAGLPLLLIGSDEI